MLAFDHLTEGFVDIIFTIIFYIKNFKIFKVLIF